jgi:hypothetical protein
MRVLVIHPYDPSTQFLRVLYENSLAEYVIMNESNSNSEIRNALNSGEYNRIMMLGHGTEWGLLSPNCRGSQNMFERDIISPQHVQFLRNIECIGIWCNANIFAERYELSGLFSGMVISELSEAMEFNIAASEDEIMSHRTQWANNLNECISQNWENISEVPDAMMNHLSENHTYLEEFNYESIFYF